MKRPILWLYGIAILLLQSGLIASAQTDQSVRQLSGPPPYLATGSVKAPNVLYQPLPSYTEAARRAGIEGIVLIQTMIRKDGTVGDCKVLRGLGYGLDESAVETIKSRWRFKPGTRDGIPVDVHANIEVAFRLYSKRTAEEQQRISEYPLRAQIVEAKWTPKPIIGADGSGYGNLLTGNSLRGFKYTCSCDYTFSSVSGRMTTYPAKWKKNDSRLEIIGFEYKGSRRLTPCELQVTLSDHVYVLRNGQVVGLTADELKNEQNRSK